MCMVILQLSDARYRLLIEDCLEGVGMRVAIVGGGASGLVTAYLLRHTHETVVFERGSVLGGHIRTINRNVRGDNIDHDVVTENGVLGFDLTTYPTFSRLAEHLGLDLISYPIHWGLFYPSGRYLVQPSEFQQACDGWWQRLGNWFRVARAYPANRRLYRQINALSYSELEHRATSEFVQDRSEPCYKLMLAAFMLAFSVPYERVGLMPAEITVGYMQGSHAPNWYILKDGVYSYIEKMIDNMPKGHERYCDMPVEYVMRSGRGVRVKAQGMEEQTFDKVVFATTPGQVLKLLQDASAEEIRRFGAWRCNQFKTIAHRDPGLYAAYQTHTHAPCDYFLLPDERRFGYNTYINHGYGHDRKVPYGFAYNLEDEIAADKVIHTADHVTPDYTVDALRYRKEVIATNGDNHTFHVGAYLGNALHEGAVQSANAVSKQLGGRSFELWMAY